MSGWICARWSKRRAISAASKSYMKILEVLTYYRPHVSGLTIYVERLARELAGRGHEVTVLTSHYAKQLPYEERLNGVRVVRCTMRSSVSGASASWLSASWNSSRPSRARPRTSR